MIVYISGKITGDPEFLEKFADADKYLQERGYTTVNPAAINSKLPEGTSWKTYMGESLRLLCGCDAIFLIDGWMRSAGAKLEYVVATHLGLVIMEDMR